MKPEERTYSIEHKNKKYLIQIRSDKGQFLTEKEVQSIVNSFNVADFLVDTLNASMEVIREQLDVADLKNRKYVGIILILSIYTAISFFL